MNIIGSDALPVRSVQRLMRSDAVLAADIVPEGAPRAGVNALLVTGATGFLGRFVVKELLRDPAAEIFCLVRASDALSARERLSDSLKAAEVDFAAHAERIRVCVGAIDQPRLGLSEADYGELGDRIGVIYHCAADVNWARGYRRLRASNVLGTQELIRLACTGTRKRICYSSSIAVCFATAGPREVNETTDMLPYVDQLALAYAQTKCVSEALLREAAARGVPVSIVRPALISGDTQSGAANPDDLICALIQGCVAAKAAIDCDWLLDCVPVDFVARVLARLGEASRPDWEVLNLFNERAPHWRELVLWLNLHGYPVQLVPREEWLSRAFSPETAPLRLFGYRRFFGVGSQRLPTTAPYETFLERAQARVCNDVTRQVLAALDLAPPALDSVLLERYFEHYVRIGVLPGAPHRRLSETHRAVRGRPARGHAILEQTIKHCLAGRNLTLLDVRERPIASHNGIFNEISSVRMGGPIGIRRYEVLVSESGSLNQQTLDVLLKSKPSDALMEDLLVEVATLCHPELGAQFARFKGDLGLACCHERELALYELAEPRLRRYMPETLGTHRDPGRGTWSVAMEYLPDAEKVAVAAAATTWKMEHVDAVLRGLAHVHAIWYQRGHELSAMPWLMPATSMSRMREMTPVWNALAEHSSHVFNTWLDQPLLPLQKAFIGSLNDWWPALRALPQTLVHNDFNPRNLVLRNTADCLSVVIFDWELAAIDVPQHDIAEFLCFVLPPNCNREGLASLLERCRADLQDAAGIPVLRDQWLSGFLLSLRYLLINRLPLYTLMHRFKPQAFLPQVVRNWRTLYRLSRELAPRPLYDAGGQAAEYENYPGAEQILGEDT